MPTDSIQNHHGDVSSKTFSTETVLPLRESKNEAIAALLVKWRWYGTFIMALNTVESREIPIAACGWNPKNGQGTMYFNPDNFPKFDLKTRIFALAHEITHWTNLHCHAPLHSMLVNIAMDMSVNSMLALMGIEPTHPEEFITVRGVYDKYKEIEPDLECPPENKSWEFYFNWLLDRKEPLKEKLKEIMNQLTKGQQDGVNEGVHPDLQDMADDHSSSLGELSAADKELVAQYIKNQVEQTSKVAKPPGELAGMLEGLIEACKPKVNWRRYLKNFVGFSGTVDVSTTRSRMNKYGGVPKVVLRPKANIAIFQDTSGSVTERELGKFWGAVEEIEKTLNLETWIGQVDVDVHAFDRFKKSRDFKYSVKGRGGTDMRNIFEYLNKRPEITIKTIVVCTDGDTPFPRPEQLRGRRVLWVMTNKRNAENIPPGIGQAIWLDVNQE